MINPADIVDALVTQLRGITGLVRLMDGDGENIIAYSDIYPIGVNFPKALRALKSPGIMVRYRSVSESSAGWKFSHKVDLYARPGSDTSYSNLVYVIMTGIPTGQDLVLPDIAIIDGLNPLRIEGEFGPQMDEEGIEYLELNLRFEET